MAFYTKCGSQLADDANFCGKCGTPTGATSTVNMAGVEDTVKVGGSVNDALKDLNELVGLKSVKEAITKIAGEPKPLNKNFVFMGNPGTGKTAVARMMGDVFKAAGLLPTNNLVEVDRSKLVGAYVGQTAKLVNEHFDKAMGGVLYIEDAYALKQGSGDMFGQEAVDMLLKQMEDNWGKIMVITSGTTKEMNEFLQLNPGLKSRFFEYINFDE
jgi:AAA+ superfamily predicted ATPase